MVRHNNVKQVLDRSEDNDRKNDRPSRNDAEVIRAAAFRLVRSQGSPLLKKCAHRVDSLPDGVRVRLNQTRARRAAETGKNQRRKIII